MKPAPPFFLSRIALIAGWTLHGLSPYATGCPICETQGGREVRAGIFGADFWPTLGALAAPFLILAAGVIWYHRRPGGAR